MPTFEAITAVLGLLLMVGALVSGLARRSVLSLTALFVLAGFVLGRGALNWIDFSARSGFVEDLAFAALIVILFRDGLEVEGEMLQRAWHLPLRKLVLAMPLTTVIVAAAARVLIGLTSSIVTNPRVPRLVRHSLNLESGLNDGLALPAVLAFLAALDTHAGHFVWWRFVLQDVGLGFLYGLACGWVASLFMPRAQHAGGGSGGSVGSVGSGSGGDAAAGIPPYQRSLFALGAAFATYGVTVLSPKGNGFIAVFVAAIVLGVRRPDVSEHFERYSEEVVELVKLGIFLVFGSLLSFDALTSEGWPALAFVACTFLLARPLAVWVALIGTRTNAATRLFMGWFGPKGVATMTFALIVLDREIPSGVRIFDLAALTVFCSILLHGITDTPGANWIAARSSRARSGGEREPGADAGTAGDSDGGSAAGQAAGG
jgi:sodium/hydrogen antiporter